MGKYKIADLNVFIENGGTKTEQRGKKYLYDYTESFAILLV